MLFFTCIHKYLPLAGEEQMMLRMFAGDAGDVGWTCRGVENDADVLTG